MEKLYQEFDKLQERFHETIENYPLLEEDIENIFDNEIKEIEEFFNKDDAYYLKKAISKLDDLIQDIKEKSLNTQKVFKEYDDLVPIWNNLKITKDVSLDKLDKINSQVKRANELIQAKNYLDVKRGYILFEEALKRLKEYSS